ncbi:MAG: PEP-CTERM sorting domain-containing protein [Phycisphaerae bacterium]|jgi:hypothetical protein|nr:PEP-CTERM sorting domain-containing protein [Phycisphaerae bacterium]
MTKYLLNLVCIIGIAGAAHAGSVANIEITPEGHAYLVFSDSDLGTPGAQSNLAGYSIEDTRALGVAIEFARGGLQDGTGTFASGWVSLDSQGVLAGEEFPGTGGTPLENWFFDGAPTPSYFLGEGNIHGYMVRDPGTPVYIGQIIDTGATGINRNLVEADFPDMGGFVAGGLFEFVEFKASDDPANVVTQGTVTLQTPAALSAGTIDLAPAGVGAPEAMYRQTGLIGAAGTDFDVSFVEGEGPGDAKIVMDLTVDVAGTDAIDGLNTVTTTKFYGDTSGFGDATADGHVTVNGKTVEIAYADLVETVVTASGDFVSAHLRIEAVDGSSTIAIDADLTEDAAGPDALGRYGTLGSALVVSLVPGDFDLDGDCDADDIDAISVQLRESSPGVPIIDPAIRSLLFDVDHDGDVDADDRLEVILSLVEVTGGNGTKLGDPNLSGTVDAGDYTTWADNFGPGTGWATGDFNGNGETEAGDYTSWADNFGQGPNDAPAPSSPVPTPEPATMMLLAVGGLATLVRRRRRS